MRPLNGASSAFLLREEMPRTCVHHHSIFALSTYHGVVILHTLPHGALQQSREVRLLPQLTSKNPEAQRREATQWV